VDVGDGGPRVEGETKVWVECVELDGVIAGGVGR
jgi:hypothetical protein